MLATLAMIKIYCDLGDYSDLTSSVALPPMEKFLRTPVVVYMLSTYAKQKEYTVNTTILTIEEIFAVVFLTFYWELIETHMKFTRSI